MSLAEQIAPHLPFLRRFSRALTGSQASGDAYVSAVLESVIEEPASLANETNVRVSLYQMLCRLWGSVSINFKPDAPAERWERNAQSRIAAIPPRPRQAFLLTGLEGFSISDTAAILDTDAEEVAELISSASEDIARQARTNILIIEDEPLIAMDLESLVTGLGHNVIGIARTRSQAVNLAGEQKPGLVLADIQLADGSSGIDAVNDILQDIELPVIFITAYPERLLTGQRPEPAFLITKPFMPEMVKAVIGQALFFDTRSHLARSRQPPAANARTSNKHSYQLNWTREPTRGIGRLVGRFKWRAREMSHLYAVLLAAGILYAAPIIANPLLMTKSSGRRCFRSLQDGRGRPLAASVPDAKPRSCKPGNADFAFWRGWRALDLTFTSFTEEAPDVPRGVPLWLIPVI